MIGLAGQQRDAGLPQRRRHPAAATLIIVALAVLALAALEFAIIRWGV